MPRQLPKLILNSNPAQTDSFSRIERGMKRTRFDPYGGAPTLKEWQSKNAFYDSRNEKRKRDADTAIEDPQAPYDDMAKKFDESAKKQADSVNNNDQLLNTEEAKAAREKEWKDKLKVIDDIPWIIPNATIIVSGGTLYFFGDNLPAKIGLGVGIPVWVLKAYVATQLYDWNEILGDSIGGPLGWILKKV
jgi:hypothetical protein